MAWPPIPQDVLDWCRAIFRDANWRLAETFLNVPSVRETTLDDILIQSLQPHAAPIRFPSGAVIRMDIHNIGGLRRVEGWEIGDIAILVFIIQQGRIAQRKIGILQAKRLYPSVGDVDEEDAVGFYYGMNAFLHPEEAPTSMLLRRKFTFDTSSTYEAMHAGSRQQQAIDHFEQKFGNAVYYLLYNPPSIPLSVNYPIRSRKKVRSEPNLGSRVLPTRIVHELLSALAKGKAPTISDVLATAKDGGWRLEEWVADLLLPVAQAVPTKLLMSRVSAICWCDGQDRLAQR